MLKSIDNKIKEPLFILNPGEYIATDASCILSTVIGVSVVVCLYDKRKKIGGMGSFIIPGSIGTEGIIADDIARHGIQSMELLIGELVKIGGNRKNFTAKLFGAGYLKEEMDGDGAIAKNNVKFLHEYFQLEKIKVENQDFGGNFRRKIYFYPHKGRAYRKKQMQNEEASEFRKMEVEYIERVFREKDKQSEFILFQ